MFKPSIARQILRVASHGCKGAAAVRSTSRPALIINTTTRSIFTTPNLNANKRDDKDDDPFKKSSTAASAEDTAEHEGRYARTDESVRVEYPEDHEMPRSPIVQGRGGMHFKRTLASFSLEGRVSVVTGGARGLGLVMGQALVSSGSDLAIVDLNSKQISGPSRLVISGSIWRDFYIPFCAMLSGRSCDYM